MDNKGIFNDLKEFTKGEGNMENARGGPFGVSCLTCPVRQHSAWQVLSEAEIHLLDRRRKAREYLAGDLVFAAGEPSNGLYCMAAGTVAIRKSDAAGNVIPIRLAYHGDIFGYRGLLLDARRRYSAEAVRASRMCFVDRAVVRSLLDRNPALGRKFLQRIASDLEDAHDNLLRHATLSNRGKFVRLLLMLMNHHGSTAHDGSQYMALPLSRRELASMIGTRQETLSRIIGRLEEDGLARFSGRTVQFTRPDALKREIQYSPQARSLS
jgi:CRP-like cAMP-binding protein